MPKLRFPEFKAKNKWDYTTLRENASIIKKKAGEDKFPVMSVESGVGLISQLEKFGRDISGKSYKNYTVIHQGDFAYNKSATKVFPEGFIAKYNDKEKVAVPNSIFTCFRLTKGTINGDYLYYQLLDNLHGRWLRKFITVGARANGALSINNEDLLNLPVPLPVGSQSIQEQQKIANCLGSLDKLIAAHTSKLEALQDHKKGLLQKLFPAEGETVPELRFPEFENTKGWEVKTIAKCSKSFSGGTPSSGNNTYYGGVTPFIRSGEINKDYTALYLTSEGLSNSAAKLVNEGDLLVALYGANSGDVAISKITGAINQAILCIRSVNNYFLCYYLTLKKDEILEKYLQGGQGNLSGEIIKSLKLGFPEADEQKAISDSLFKLDKIITKISLSVDDMKNHKKALMQQLFPNSN